jgi:predicted Zn-dependent protease
MRFTFSIVVTGVLALAGCAGNPPRPQPSVTDMLAAIHAAGQHDDSAVHVKPLRDPAAQQWVDKARTGIAAGHAGKAASDLDHALRLAPKDPGILQDRAELAVRRHHYARAEQLARQSWSAGPRLGGLCARNWQTVLEMRKLAHDAAGVAQARSQRGKCRVNGVTRM